MNNCEGSGRKTIGFFVCFRRDSMKEKKNIGKILEKYLLLNCVKSYRAC